MLTLRLYMAQRLSALIMAPLTLGHLAVMIYAVQGGVSVAEILGRTQGSLAWFLFYGSFVVAVAVHAAIGLRVIMFELCGLKGVMLTLFGWLVFAILLGLGGRAVWAVTFAGGGL
jgi:fumarate reductase subunit C